MFVGGGLDEDFAKEISSLQYAHLAFPSCSLFASRDAPAAGGRRPLQAHGVADAVIDAVDVFPRTTLGDHIRAALRDDLQALMASSPRRRWARPRSPTRRRSSTPGARR